MSDKNKDLESEALNDNQDNTDDTNKGKSEKNVKKRIEIKEEEKKAHIGNMKPDDDSTN